MARAATTELTSPPFTAISMASDLSLLLLQRRSASASTTTSPPPTTHHTHTHVIRRRPSLRRRRRGDCNSPSQAARSHGPSIHKTEKSKPTSSKEIFAEPSHTSLARAPPTIQINATINYFH